MAASMTNGAARADPLEMGLVELASALERGLESRALLAGQQALIELLQGGKAERRPRAPLQRIARRFPKPLPQALGRQ